MLFSIKPNIFSVLINIEIFKKLIYIKYIFYLYIKFYLKIFIN